MLPMLDNNQTNTVYKISLNIKLIMVSRAMLGVSDTNSHGLANFHFSWRSAFDKCYTVRQ